MKKKYAIALLSFALLLTNNNLIAKNKKSTKDIYQFVVYHFKTTDQLAVTENYVKNTYLPALHSLGFKQVGVFTPIANDTAIDKRLYIMVTYSNIEQIEKTASQLIDNQLIKSDSTSYSNAAFNKIPYERMESIILTAFPNMTNMRVPSLTGARANRVYELRSYEAPTERYYQQKVKMFNDGGEVKLFERLQFHAVFYGSVLSGSRMPNLMYMTTFNNKTERDEHWKKFSSDPEWKTLSALPEYLNTVSKADIMFLRPTEYSDF